MENMKIPVEVDPNEDSEWNDILRSHGIIPEKPPSPTAQLEEALDEAVKKQHENRLESKDLDELEELEDEEDEDFLNSYKAKRMDELKKLNEKKKFGYVLPLSKDEYETEVTQASNEYFVIVHMSLLSSLQSRLIASILIEVASKFPEIKICDIPATRCIENYPESNCPTLVIYHKTKVVKQYITLVQLGGNSTRLGDVERVLVDIGAVDINDKRLLINQEEEEDLANERRLKFVKKSLRGRSNDSHNGDDEDDDFYE